MDSTSAPPPSYEAAPEIPSDIFRPLLAIAQRQYEANDVKQYYLTMLRHLRRMGTVNSDAAYAILSPISDKKAPLSGMEGVQAVRTVDDDGVSPKTNPMTSEPSFEPSYEPGQNDQLQIATSSSQRTYHVLNEVSRQIETEMPPTLPPRQDSQQFCESSPHDMVTMLPTASAQHDPNAIRAASLPTQQFGTIHQPVLQPWVSHEQYHLPTHQGYQQSHGFIQHYTPSPVPYHASVNTTPLPMHNAFSPPPQHQQIQQQQQIPQQYQQQQYHQQYQQQQMYESDQESFLGPLGNSLGLSRLANNFADEFYGSPLGPMIDVIPSRKRKALMQKGVRRFTGVM